MDARTLPSAEVFTSHRFDFIVVGGGTGGLAVASRLAENLSLTIGVLEAGRVAGPQDNIDIPALYGNSLGGEFDWCFKTEPQQALAGRSLPWPRGKVLGGTSALNFMTWNRGSKEDYDAWEALGNSGWGWNDLLPFFKKSETFHPPIESVQREYDVSHDREAFGSSGPIQVSYSTDYSPSHGLWHRTLNALGVKTNPAHVAGSNVGVWTNVNTVDPETASRCYATSYVSALPQSSNLFILSEADVQQIVLSNGDGGEVAATGVRFKHQGKEHVVTASREIILSAGTVKSPQLLELSGIGKRDVLTRAGIPVIVESPQVGENLQEHIMLIQIFEVDSSLKNPDDLKSDKTAIAKEKEQFLRNRNGPLTILPVSICYVPLKHIVDKDLLSRLSNDAGKLLSLDPQKDAIQNKRLDGSTNLGQLEYIFDIGNWHPTYKGEKGKNYGTMLQILQYPFSVGSIHIRPRDDGQPFNAADAPSIDPAYYGGSRGRIDFNIMKEGMRFASIITKTEPLASIVQGPACPQQVAMEDDSKLEQWIVENTVTDWHPIGTCSMSGNRGIDKGVVDERLRVHGVKGLRVVDASIMPLHISGHVQATIYAIAEKAAHMILEDIKR